jgi:hypothetical protein
MIWTLGFDFYLFPPLPFFLAMGGVLVFILLHMRIQIVALKNVSGILSHIGVSNV